ncbi:MAG: hypothetical protein KDC95_13340 [Planctomycetes bacterium]|nr:hypothetical protein [Planctomycetota bacterium]
MNRWRVVLFLVAVAAVAWIFAVGPYREMSTLFAPRAPFDEVPATSASEARDILARIGLAGRDLVRTHLLWDIGTMIANAVIVWSLLRAALPANRLGGLVAVTLACVPMLLDGIENFAIARVVAGWEAPQRAWVDIARIVTTGKLVALAVAAAAFLVAIVVRITAKLHASRRHRPQPRHPNARAVSTTLD